MILLEIVQFVHYQIFAQQLQSRPQFMKYAVPAHTHSTRVYGRSEKHFTDCGIYGRCSICTSTTTLTSGNACVPMYFRQGCIVLMA